MGPEVEVKRYPDLQPAIPSSRANASITVRILKPGIVLGTVGLLAVCSVSGTVIAGSVFRGGGEAHCMSVMAAQGIVLTAVSLRPAHLMDHS
jgi:hypothetical protein